jgi:hypothetical protein
VGQATDERSGSESAITIPGTGDHDAPESTIRINRNERSGWTGTGDQDASEYAPSGRPRGWVAWAATTGPATAELVTAILAAKPHPEQGYRACLGLMRQGKTHGAARLEAAARATWLGAASYRTVHNILASGLDRVPLTAGPAPSPALPIHPNIRGSAYYTREEPLCLLTPPSMIRPSGGRHGVERVVVRGPGIGVIERAEGLGPRGERAQGGFGDDGGMGVLEDALDGAGVEVAVGRGALQRILHGALPVQVCERVEGAQVNGREGVHAVREPVEKRAGVGEAREEDGLHFNESYLPSTKPGQLQGAPE